MVVTFALGHSATGETLDEGTTTPSASTVPTLPNERGGQESIGQQWPDLRIEFIERSGAAPPDSAEEDAPVVTLYRWWTNGCPYCEKSLPAIEDWRKRFESQGLRTVAIYHPKPPREVSETFVRRAAAELGYHGELAIDHDWSALRRATRGWRDRRATSVSFLVDHHGIIRFVHPGPDFFPSDEAQHHRQNNDHALLEDAIEILLKSLPEPAADDPDIDANPSP